MPDDGTLKQYYQGFAFRKPDPTKVAADLARVKASLLHFIGEPERGRNLFLDYGGGFGIYSEAARQLGWEPYLFDYDEPCLKFAQAQFGLQHVAADLNDFATQRFDVIFGFHVIEHWNQIDGNMDRLKAMLAPGGRMVFATPHADSLEKLARPFHLRNYIRGLRSRGEPTGRALRLCLRTESVFCWDPPRHLFAYTRESLRAVGARHGLTAEVMTGYNTSALHEPRQDVLGVPFQRSGMKGFLEGLAALGTRGLCRVFAVLFPERGEQLYVILSKAD
jgi:SAM-dependent methyltransferase